MSYIDTLSPAQRANVHRVRAHAIERSTLAGHAFEMSPEEVAEAIDAFGGSLDDESFILPAGLVGPA